jgi:hypothetical protein
MGQEWLFIVQFILKSSVIPMAAKYTFESVQEEKISHLPSDPIQVSNYG